MDWCGLRLGEPTRLTGDSMKINRYRWNIWARSYHRSVLLTVMMTIVVVASTRLRADTGVCGGASITLPFTDVPSNNIFFCSIAEAYFSALTNGTSPTTYSPSDPVPREQMAAFITRTLDQALAQGSRRAALRQFQIPKSNYLQKKTPVGVEPQNVASDGEDLWVTNSGSGTISRVRASDGKHFWIVLSGANALARF